MRNRTFQTPEVEPISRRSFVKLATAAGLLLGVQLPGCAPGAEGLLSDDEADGLRQAIDPANPATAAFAPNAFVRISDDNWVTVMVKFQEMGQGTATGCATLVAEELDADWARVRVAYAPSNPAVYNNVLFGPVQGTGGSTAMRGSFMQLRQAGATARALLVAAAAAQWKVAASTITVANGVVSGGGKRATFGELAKLAAAQPVPATPPALKAATAFKLIGKNNLQRVDTAAKSNGTALYTIDVKLPGLLTAVIARPPTFNAKLVSFDPAPALAVKGVTDVVQVPEGVAVVANGMWPAIKGRRALKVEWDVSPDAALSSETMYEDYKKLAATPGAVVNKAPGTDAALAAAPKKVEAVYEFPFLAHAPIEPLNCVAWFHDGKLETWSGHQFHSFDHQNAAAASGLPAASIQLNTLVAGGSFGRRSNQWSDFVVEAINVAKAIKRPVPVRVQRTREDDMTAAQYRPLYVHNVSAGLGADGKVAGWKHTVVGQAIYQAGNPIGPNSVGNDGSTIEGMWPQQYAIPNMSVEMHSPKQPIRPLWYRSVGHTHNAFVVETVLDELAVAAGKDPVAFRLELLGDRPRHRAVLQLAAEKFGWSKAPAAGRAYGIALHESFASYVAMAVEVSLREDKTPKVERVVATVDCGVAINPDIIRSQIEGGLGFGLASALYGDLNIVKGALEETNFDLYRLMRIDDMPKVEVHIVPSPAAPTGVGEIGVPPIAPAVANALFKLTGKRTRRLPFSRGAEQV
ncbi:MAG: xanthine dehydrogenase family protein molybdopterin-binding subunit [Polyangiales bacterium]